MGEREQREDSFSFLPSFLHSFIHVKENALFSIKGQWTREFDKVDGIIFLGNQGMNKLRVPPSSLPIT